MLVVYAMIEGWLAERFSERERGATAVEYGLLVGLIAVAIIAAVTLLGGNLTSLFNNIANSITH